MFRSAKRGLIVAIVASFVPLVPAGDALAGPISDACSDEACFSVPTIPGLDPDAIYAVGIADVAFEMDMTIIDPTLPPVMTVSTAFGAAQITDPFTGALIEDPTVGDAFVTAADNRPSYACVANNTNGYFHAGKPATLTGKNDKWQYRYQFHPYVQYYARVVSGQYTYQPELCATGGVDGQNGWRTLYNASIMAARTKNASNRIGLAADSGSSGSTSSASIQVGVTFGPVTISANVPTHPQGSLAGYPGSGKYSSHADAYFETESVGQWTAGCTWHRNCGSSNMQTQVHHGLFEYVHGVQAASFIIDAQWNYYCSGPYGQGCG